MMVEKSDGHVVYIYRDNIVDIIPPLRNRLGYIVLRGGFIITLSEETNIGPIVEWAFGDYFVVHRSI